MEQITMPQLGETVTEGTIIRWLKREGDAIAADEGLFDVSTDKVDAEVPSAFGGVVRALLVAEGETVPIGTPVALIGASADEPLPHDTAGSAPSAPTRPSAPPRAAPARPDTPVRRESLSPVVRQLLDEHGLAASSVVGSGRDGRITRADVLAAAANAGARGAPVRPVAEPGPTDEVVPFSRARRATAAAMSASLATAAHALVTTEVDYGTVDPVRREAGLTYLPFVARAAIDALAAFPYLNASVGDDCLIVHRQIHLGIAVDLDHEALVVPVVHDADARRLISLAEAFAEVAERARAHRLGAAELSGATMTITNVGAQGTVVSAPIILQPQVAILSTDGVRMRPVAVAGPGGEWAVAVRPVGNLSLSFDHRAVDGAYAASFLARVRETIQTRDWRDEVRP